MMSRASGFIRTLPDVVWATEEIWEEGPYFYENLSRGGRKVLVIQQTLNGSAFLEDESGRHIVDSGKAMIFRHGENSRYGLDKDCETPYRQRWIQLWEAEPLRMWADSIIAEFGSVLRMSIKGEASKILAQRIDEENRGVLRDRLYLAELGCRLLFALYREQIGFRKSNDPVGYGHHLLTTQFRSSRNLQEWCEYLGISREHFSREFRQRYGESPASYLRNLRLQYANGILELTGVTQAEVAFASGFSSEQTFHRAYTRYFGHPPGRKR